jgi:hypothetical protein
MRSFVAWHRQVPPAATRLEDFVARAHTAPWLRRTIGQGLAGSYVIGFELQHRWWTFFFEREGSALVAPEPWWIQSYSHDGKSWQQRFLYWPVEDHWRHESYREHGDDHGRFRRAVGG